MLHTVNVFGVKIREAISRLGQLLRINHFSDRPKECSCISFGVDTDKISAAAAEMIVLAEQYSYLIKIDEPQKDKNHPSKQISKYQINRMLCPKWDLPIRRRGSKQLNEMEANAIFEVFQPDDSVFEALRDKWEDETSMPTKLQGSLF